MLTLVATGNGRKSYGRARDSSPPLRYSRPAMENTLDNLPACAGCGQCCHLLVELMPGVDVVPEAFVVEHDGVRCLEQHGDGACIALDRVTRLCTIYDDRPQVCRQFDRGSGLCRIVLGNVARRHPFNSSNTISDGLPPVFAT